MSLNLSGLRPENTELQVHRSLPALLARKPGRPGARRGPGPQNRRRSGPQSKLESGTLAIQPTPQVPNCPLTSDFPPLTLTPTPGPVSDSAPGPLRTEAEAAEKTVRTPQLECPVDCLTNSFKETN